MPMILPEKTEDVMNDWPTYWSGRPMRRNREFSEILENLKILWHLVAQESFSEEIQELHFKALWFIGYELSRDRIMSKYMFTVPIKLRIKQIIEDQGPLLFGFYTSEDEQQFGMCCETFERLLRRACLWEEFSQRMALN